MTERSRSRFLLVAKHRRQFAGGHPVSDGDRVIADERFGPLIQHRAGDDRAGDRVRPIEDDERDVVLGSRLHRVAHRRDVRVEAGSDVLNVEHEHVQVLQRLGRRRASFAVEADDLQSGRCIGGIADDACVELACKAVLRAEQNLHVDPLCVVQQLDRADSFLIDAGVIGDQTDPFSL